jgi:ABC-type Na+ efflux pump permease subunit
MWRSIGFLPENPVFKREIRMLARQKYTLIIMVSLLLVNGGLTLIMDKGIRIPWLWYSEITLTITNIIMLQVCLIAPNLTAGAVLGEKERETYECLITTSLSSWDIIIGKMAAAYTFLLIFIALNTPLVLLFSPLADEYMRIPWVITSFGMMLMTGLLYSSIGIYWSVVTDTMSSAVVYIQTTMVALFFGGTLLLNVLSFILIPFMVYGVLPAVFIFIPSLILLTPPFLLEVNGDILVEGGYIIVWTLITWRLLVVAKRRLSPIARHRRNYPPFVPTK